MKLLCRTSFRHISIALVILTLTSWIGCTSPEKQNDSEAAAKIHIGVAANMQFAMDELIAAFEEESGIKAEQVVSSSGKLTAQILEGAPLDVLVSADMKYPEEIYRSGLAISEPQVYAYGKLVLWTMVEQLDPTIENLSDPRVRHIALANPKTAPYGAAAVEVMDHLGLTDILQTKLVFGESIAQTNQFIISRSTELGFTAMSVVLSPGIRDKGRWTVVDNSWYTPIAQGVVPIKSKKSREAGAKRFCDFLRSPKALDILERYGYSVDPPR